MNARAAAGIPAYLAYAYIAALFLVSDSALDLPTLLGVGVTVTLGALTSVGAVRDRLLVGPAWAALALGVAIGALPTEPFGPAGAALAGGIVLASPFLWIEYVGRSDASPGTRVLALEAMAIFGTLGLATLVALAPTGHDVTGQAYLAAMAAVVGAQFHGLIALLGGAAAPALPLSTIFDPIFLALVALATLGLLLDWAIPRNALGEALPWSWSVDPDDPDLGGRVPPELPLRPDQRATIESRTRPRVPATAAPPGFGAFLVAGGAVALLIVAADRVPVDALLFLAVGLAAAVGAVVALLHRRLTPTGGLAA